MHNGKVVVVFLISNAGLYDIVQILHGYLSLLLLTHAELIPSNHTSEIKKLRNFGYVKN
jgi:hypothetical protein